MDATIAKRFFSFIFKLRWILIGLLSVTLLVSYSWGGGALDLKLLVSYSWGGGALDLKPVSTPGRILLQHVQGPGSAPLQSGNDVGDVHTDNNATNQDEGPRETLDFTRNCTSHFGATLEEDLAKIDSYKFEGIDNYIKDLFPSRSTEPEIPEVPVFVTGFSSNHFAEGKVLLQNLDNTVRRHFKNVTVIVFDLGLSANQVNTLNAEFSLETRTFPFDRYPSHVSRLQTYTWKPIIVQTVAKEHPFVVWLDASVRFKTGDLEELFEQVKKQGLVTRHPGMQQTGSISERTHQATFQFLQEDPCLYGEQMEKAGTFIFVSANQFITKYFLRPWVSCALAPGCMDPIPGSGRLIICPGNTMPHKYHLCHRFDQSVLGILFTRLFHRNLQEHALNLKYLMVCGSTIISPKTCYHYDD